MDVKAVNVLLFELVFKFMMFHTVEWFEKIDVSGENTSVVHAVVNKNVDAEECLSASHASSESKVGCTKLFS